MFEHCDIVDEKLRKKPRKTLTEWPEVEMPEIAEKCKVADTHAHLNMLSNPALALARCARWGVSFVESMCDPLSKEGLGIYDEIDVIVDSSKEILNNFEDGNNFELPKIRFACGIHPLYVADIKDEAYEQLQECLSRKITSALGEVGLDYHYETETRDLQIEVFERQIEMCKEASLPIILHVREAHDDAFAILKNAGFVDAGMLLHCYTSDEHEIKRWVDEGCYVAFGGAFTFKKLDEVREAVRYVPKERLLSETDSPFMAPEPFRGCECEPVHTLFTVQRICDYLGIVDDDSRIEFTNQMFENARQLLDR